MPMTFTSCIPAQNFGLASETTIPGFQPLQLFPPAPAQCVAVDPCHVFEESFLEDFVLWWTWHDTLTARKNDTCFHFRRGPGGLKVPEAIARTDVLLIARAVGRFGQRSATAVVGDDDPGVVVSRYAQTCLLDRDGLPLEDVVGTHPDFGWRQRKFVNEQHGSRFPRDGRGAVDPGKASFVCAPAADKIVLHEAT